MADETTSAVASDSPPKGQANLTSEAPPTKTELPTAATTAPETRQAETVRAEDFRQMQQQLTLQMRQRDQQLQQANQALAATNRRLQELEMRDLPDEQRETYLLRQQLQQMQAELAQRDQYTRQAQIELDANAEINDMVEEFSVPFSELKQKWNEGLSPRQLWRYARAQEKERATAATKATARADRANANASVDLGGGRPISTGFETKMAEARKKGPQAVARLMFDEQQ